MCAFLQVGHVGLWTVDENSDEDNAAQGMFQFKPHTGAVPRLTFDPVDNSRLISTSYDGTVRRMDVEKGVFEEVKNGWCFWVLAFLSVLVVGVWCRC